MKLFDDEGEAVEVSEADVVGHTHDIESITNALWTRAYEAFDADGTSIGVVRAHDISMARRMVTMAEWDWQSIRPAHTVH
ncbi:hypothetical protein [Paraburkholderia unamae]|uniref:Uncharacterized protein n=1 Tax=Paraburkholderia unamae TaxID=219649 RepID=A0ACC6RGW7_9BURK